MSIEALIERLAVALERNTVALEALAAAKPTIVAEGPAPSKASKAEKAEKDEEPTLRPRPRRISDAIDEKKAAKEEKKPELSREKYLETCSEYILIDDEEVYEHRREVMMPTLKKYKVGKASELPESAWQELLDVIEADLADSAPKRRNREV